MTPDPLTILVTGFEPFAASTLNPSQVVVESLADGGAFDAGGSRLHTALLPVDTARVVGEVDRLWRDHSPDVVLHFGESAKADRVTLERVAVNLLDFDRPDNAGQHLADTPIDPTGPAARFATLPVRALSQRLEQAGHASHLSLSAGAYLCNQVLYLSLAHGERLGGRSVGFVHVPSLPEQAERGERTGPTMPRVQLIEAALGLVRFSAEAHRATRGSARDEQGDRN
ncbi:MAG: pyroglutamyl-peptidase I [Phycisphaeraceae bacterium]